jgi:hypothetical protein
MRFCASMVVFASTAERSPTATIVSPRTPMSARNQGEPVPSRTRPLMIFRSSMLSVF